MNSQAPAGQATVLVYSSNREVRAQVINALGQRPAADLPEIDVLETATEPATLAALDAGRVDLAILDGEAYPGGMGMARQLKDEIFECPPLLVLTGRPQDAWLATWSRADAVVPRPLSPFDLARASAELLRRRLQSAPSA
jgi:DNA-binding response OmpR family regulator